MGKCTKQSKPLSFLDKKLQERFAEDITHQSRLMDDIGKILITIQLAVPSVYALILKLSLGDKYILSGGIGVLLIFIFWFGSLVFTFLAIFPRKYQVNINRLDEIEKFYFGSAKTKMKFLIVSILLFCVGTIYSVFILIEKGI